MFRERLKILRSEKNMTQDDLAKAIGSTRSTIAGYESTKDPKETDFKTLKKIADYFGCTTDYLLGVSDIRHPDIAIIAAERKENIPFTDDDIRILEGMIQHLKKKYGAESTGSVDNGGNTGRSGTTGDNH